MEAHSKASYDWLDYLEIRFCLRFGEFTNWDLAGQVRQELAAKTEKLSDYLVPPDTSKTTILVSGFRSVSSRGHVVGWKL
ncbi:hypothetical protein AFLA70_603g000631 [Aspergillus flavus AF70]|nr:hypothetical protein AFLA70_603g000631 [Aspergillus flavus AF70]